MSYVYAISRADGPIKIGFTTQPRRRRSGLDTASPAKLDLLFFVEGSRAHERHLHQVLAAHRIRGEWFSPHPVVLATLERVKRGDWMGFVPPPAKPEQSPEIRAAARAADFIMRGEVFLGRGRRDKFDAVWKFKYRSTEPTLADYEELLQGALDIAAAVEAEVQSIRAFVDGVAADHGRERTQRQFALMDAIQSIRNTLQERVHENGFDQASHLAA